MSERDFVRARWWLSLPAALLCLAALDAALSFWRPFPSRLPEHFSPAYLSDYVDRIPRDAPIVFLGDSVLWGYGLAPSDAIPAILQSRRGLHNVINLSYEGGSSANSYFMLRYLLQRGVEPQLIVLQVNSKESNPSDSAYNRLHPSLERLVRSLLSGGDRAVLQSSLSDDFGARLQRMAERFWRLYRYRTDVREALFDTDDAASALRDAVQKLTGSARLQALAHRPNADKFLGTYDIEPLSRDNVDFVYLRKLANLIERSGIPAVAFLTPTNHRLLHDYIDAPGYDARLLQITTTLKNHRIVVLNLDRAIPPRQFIDNDHLTAVGDRRLADILNVPMLGIMDTR